MAVTEPINDALLADIASDLLRRAASSPRRLIIGIAGTGAAGKSTLAARLQASVNAQSPRGVGAAVLVPMDGFHFSNAVLDQLNRRQRKGAPDTFDVAAFLALLRRLRGEQTGDDGRDASPIPFPVYDRALHEPILRPQENAVAVHHRIVITEGNYLLLDEHPWTQLADLLDECWFLDTPLEQSRQWMLARHVRGGRTEGDAAAHYKRSDLANAQLVQQRMRPPHRVLRW